MYRRAASRPDGVISNVGESGLRFEEHPVLAPARLLFDQHLGIKIDPVAIVVMSSGVRYLDPIGSSDAFGGFDAAFDLFEAAGFNCEQFQTNDCHQFLETARREHRLSESRWRATPFYSLYPEIDPVEGSSVVVPVGLSEFGDRSVRVTSKFADRAIDYREFLDASLDVWGYAAPVPSLQAIIAPARFGFAASARRSLRLLLQRMHVALNALPMLEGFLDTEPTTGDLDLYRRRLRAVCSADASFARSLLVDAIDAFGSSFVPEATRSGFVLSSRLHHEFLAGDDRALAEIARVERAALDNRLNSSPWNLA